MTKRSKSKTSTPKVDPYLEGLIAKLIDRLVGLEKKIDIVVTQTASRSAGNGDSPKSSQAHEAQKPQHRDRQLYEAICADCHKVCEVPFRPSEDRPVYCKECFAKRKAGLQPRPGMPVLTPVSLPPKPASKLAMPSTPSPAGPPRQTPKSPKKKSPVKKGNKKKK